ncbi:hypothetical protein [Piscirickettsia salmonis]|uniref:hypothetical protein n=1 Tax=Piscirickettsia salmonis TaxID=1238 RepID=UPI0018AC9EA4|nr:hypothetical protein [Piscirickettsia salmonis]
MTFLRLLSLRQLKTDSPLIPLNLLSYLFIYLSTYLLIRKRRYLGRYFAHPMMQNRRAKRDDYKPSAVRVTQRYVP